LAPYDRWLEMDRALAERERHASLAAKILRRPRYAVRERDVDRLVSAVDDGLTKLCAQFIRRSEKSDVLSSKNPAKDPS